MLLEARRIGRFFTFEGRRIDVLRDVDLSVPAGQTLAITGPSGSGKTTLLHILALLDDGYEGELHIDGADVRSMDRSERATTRLRNVGLVFQSFRLVPWLSALENVALPHWTLNGDRQAALAAGRSALERVGLRERFDHRPALLSGGEQQRVGVARAVVNNPRLILADEPTGNLDRVATGQVLKVLADVAGPRTALVVVTHDPEVAAAMDRHFDVPAIPR